MELNQSSERCYHLHLTNECNAREMSEIMTNKAQGTPGTQRNYGNGKEGKQCWCNGIVRGSHH